MNNLAIISDKAEHHPEWFNVFNTVKVIFKI
jgi:pterin-4a-carbinolamine dehydratase